MNKEKEINLRRQRRRWRVRKKLRGNAERPRMSVSKSLQHVYCQIIDDATGRTLASASSRDQGLRENIPYGGNRDAAAVVGKVIAEKALAIGVRQVQFDRGHNRYHGRVAALADAAREAGLKF